MPDKEKYSRGFDLECKGVEISSGSQRIHDVKLLIERLKACGLDPKDFDAYLKAFRFGMPPHGGFGFGIERFLMELLDLNNIRECIGHNLKILWKKLDGKIAMLEKKERHEELV
jgi:aspartyl-tRNA synthetase